MMESKVRSAKPNLRRLRMLATHLRSGALGVNEFSFKIYHRKLWVEEGGQRQCKSLGCAVGEMPTLWPDFFGFKEEEPYRGQIFADVIGLGNLTRLRESHTASQFWFGLDMLTGWLLFTPTEMLYMDFDKDLARLYPELAAEILTLPGTATKEQVAGNIERFCQIWEAAGWPVSNDEDDMKFYEAEHRTTTGVGQASPL